VRRVPLLSGSRVILVPVGEGDVVITPPPPPAQVVDVDAAVRDALRFPLSGPSLEEAATPGGRVTIVVEPPALPMPGTELDPRQVALASTLHELEQVGFARERQTLLVAGGLARRAGHDDLARLLPPPVARAFRGSVLVHDVEDHLVPVVGEIRAHPALVETDLVLVLGAAETVLHGGPGSLLAACDAATVRHAADATPSLLDAGRGQAWPRVLEVEEAIAARAPLLGVSLILDLPRLQGLFRGYPYDAVAVSRVARSWTRALFSTLPGAVRRAILDSAARRVTVTAAYAGRPSVAHAEALVRGVDLRGVELEGPVDALVVGAPWIGPHLPREPANPVTAAAVALGLALRLHRDAYPIAGGGTLVLAHPFTRSFGRGETPYATMLAALRAAGGPHDAGALEAAAAEDERAVGDYRAGRACHPLLPYADWAGCADALTHLGRVVVAGCRDAAAARALGLVPSHGVTSALQMAHGVAGGKARIGVLLAPPYPPLLVGPPA
jgi:Lactate racemase N-terminal domain